MDGKAELALVGGVGALVILGIVSFTTFMAVWEHVFVGAVIASAFTGLILALKSRL